MCGEKCTPFSLAPTALGSPPRVRGKGVICTCPQLWHRITPACAGKSADNVTVSVVSQDHPRVCGEKGFTAAKEMRCLGSPPRVRGKVIFLLLDFVLLWDHPRVCGEKLYQIVSVEMLDRITPACAGKSYLACRPGTNVLGSPPCVRGKGHDFCSSAVFHRITPACAGKSLHCRLFIENTWDHPRVCGEKITIRNGFLPYGGSPPRVRGKVDRMVQAIRADRITPACAGKSHQLRFLPCVPTGSPPRVRGKVRIFFMI